MHTYIFPVCLTRDKKGGKSDIRIWENDKETSLSQTSRPQYTIFLANSYT